MQFGIMSRIHYGSSRVYSSEICPEKNMIVGFDSLQTNNQQSSKTTKHINRRKSIKRQPRSLSLSSTSSLPLLRAPAASYRRPSPLATCGLVGNLQEVKSQQVRSPTSQQAYKPTGQQKINQRSTKNQLNINQNLIQNWC